MFKKLIFYISFSFLIIYNCSELHAEVKNIIPLKKPLLDSVTLENKLTQGILKPRPKPIKGLESNNLSKEIIKPKNKPTEEAKKPITKIVEKKIKKIKFLKPKNKPVTVKKTSTTKKKK